MNRSKEMQPLSDAFKKLNSNVAGQIVGHSSLRDILSVLRTDNANYQLFAPLLKRALTYVTHGNLKALLPLIKSNPKELFEQHDIIDPRGRLFYKVSAYQKMIFLCDADMKHKIMPLIPDSEAMKLLCQAQEKELGKGGADLIKLDKDPLLPNFKFDEITQFKQTFTLYTGEKQEINYPLLENQDGIIYFQDDNKKVHFYYANLETQEITLLNPSFTSEEDKQDFEAFKASFESMEDNSGRRSSNKEHQLITKIMQRTLIRQGIFYKQNGIVYRDSQSPFHLINAYRTCLRLYLEAEQNWRWDKADDYWCKGVGIRQGEEMWLLQRICEKNRPFNKYPKHFNDFSRNGFACYLWSKEELHSAFADGKLHDGLGTSFALGKGENQGVVKGLLTSLQPKSYGAAWIDLIAVCRLIEDAKANIVKQEPEFIMLENCSLQ